MTAFGIATEVALHAVDSKLEDGWHRVKVGALTVSKHRANSYAGTANRNQSVRRAVQEVRDIILVALKKAGVE